MATRIRSVKPDFFRHSGLFRLEQQTRLPIRLGFEGLWIVADREGRFRWKPEELKLDVLPYDDVDFAVLMAELERHRFVVQYRVDGELYGFIPTWTRHQRPNHKESQSRLPPPPESVSREAQLQLEMSAESGTSVPVSTGSSRGHDAVVTASSRVGQEGKSNSGGRGRGRGTGSGTGGGSGADASKTDAPSTAKTDPPTITIPAIVATSETPPDLTELEYARQLLEDLGMPGKGNIVVVAESIKAFASTRQTSLPAAFEQMRAIAFDARDRGETINHFWFQDAKYLQLRKKTKTEVATDEFHDRFDRERAILQRHTVASA